MMQNTEPRIPLWVIAITFASGIITLCGIFFYGSYSGLGSSL